jgi:hypothetical protein
MIVYFVCIVNNKADLELLITVLEEQHRRARAEQQELEEEAVVEGENVVAPSMVVSRTRDDKESEI